MGLTRGFAHLLFQDGRWDTLFTPNTATCFGTGQIFHVFTPIMIVSFPLHCINGPGQVRGISLAKAWFAVFLIALGLYKLREVRRKLLSWNII